MEEVLKDERFSHILTDPSFRRIPRKVRKTKVDNRFKALLKNKRFTDKCNVDEHGCALNLDSSENLNKLYNLDEESSESEDRSVEDKINKTKKLTKSVENGKKKLKVKKLAEKGECLTDNSEKVVSESSLNREKTYKIKKIENKETKQDLKCKGHQSSTFDDEDENELSANKNINELHKNSSINNNNNLSNLHNNSCVSKSLEKRKQAESDLRFKEVTDSEEESSGEESDEDNEKQYESENVDSSEEDSDEDSESDDSDSKASDDTFDHQWEEQHERAPDADEITRRLAVCHMDWDRIRAVDLFAAFNSFKPPDASIISVKIYPSEFGLQRMEEEKLHGPRELVEKTLAVDEEEVEDKKGSKYHREKLRQYQMKRLKYFYAIVECDTPETADYLYEQLNGMEYESSSVRFDLRFVPDDTTFDHEPTSVAEKSDLTEYKPRLFVTTALQQVKVGLTWDETDPHRREVLQKAFTEPDNNEKDVKEYLAPPSDDSEEEITDTENIKLSTKEKIRQYKALLEVFSEEKKEKSEEKYDKEISWQPGVKEETKNLVKGKLEEKSYTPFEELQKKMKEKQKLKKKEKKAITHELQQSEDELSEMSDSDASTEMKVGNLKKEKTKTNDELYLISDAKKKLDAENEQLTKRKKKQTAKEETTDDFLDELYPISDAKKVDVENEQLTKKKKKKKAKQETTDDFQIDVNDPRFSAIYTSPLFNIDPSDPHFKSTPGNLALIAEKQRRLKNKNGSREETKSNKKFKYS